MSSRLVDPDDLGGITEVSRAIPLTPGAIRHYLNGRRKPPEPFPKPVRKLASGYLFLVPECVAWADRNLPHTVH